ncbi:MAG TPA: response regulator [Polyangiaceae bacterium]|nr:response regulator [Polyangiaceae bacterium]
MSSAAHEGKHLSFGKILLVEDNPDDVALTLRALRKNSISNEVVVATDGQEALDWLFCEGAHAQRDAKDQPAIVLLDVKLPKIDGLEVLRTLRADARTRLHRVVMLTTSREEQDVLESYSLGASSFIRKPIDFDEFIRVVGQIGRYWLIINEPVPSP